MGKQLIVICAPFSTRSGYGDHARDLFYSFYNLDKYDIQLMDVRWGNTPRNALRTSNEKHKLILDRIINDPSQITRQPDIYVDIRIPNEFQTIGKFNIGITAGIETHAVSPAWIEGCNKMDLIIVPSEHSKSGFVLSNYDKMQETPQGPQNLGHLKLEKPIEVLFEGADLQDFRKLDTPELNGELFDDINSIPEDSIFLILGQWVKGNYGEDRKDIGRTIKIFFETFIGYRKKPALLLKTNGATFSILDKEEINMLYNHPKVKSLVSFTHGEGFGRPLLEATMTGLPVIASNWSGHIDFLDENKSILVKGTTDKVPQSAVWENIIIPESEWFTINDEDASRSFELSYKNNESVREQANDLMEINRNKFSHDKMTEKLGDIMEKYTSDVQSTAVELPKLKKLKLPESKKMEMSNAE